MTPIGEACLSALEAVAQERLELSVALHEAAAHPGITEAERWRITWEAVAETDAYLHLNELARYYRIRRRDEQRRAA
jgi:hypothetical protein